MRCSSATGKARKSAQILPRIGFSVDEGSQSKSSVLAATEPAIMVR
jgi:hypothetical protein